MSSLSASLARSGAAEPDRVRRMLEAAPHRGTQLDVRPLGACTLGVSRREDDDHAGVSSGERLVAAFAGRLDNGPELRGARRMNAAALVTADRDGVSAERLYWHPERLVESGRYTPDEARERFAELFDQAVGRCLSGRDAISLSGGIDSTAVAAFAAPG